MKTVVVQHGQDLFDIALQEYGSVESVFDLASDNGIDDITGDLIPGSLLTIDDSKIINKEVVDYYNNNDIKPATYIN